MSSRQRECRLCMIECGRLPYNIRMAGDTIMGKLTCRMIRRHNFCKIRLVTAVTVNRQSCIAAIGVAGRTLHGNMSSRQRKCRLRMIERGRLPYNVGMTRDTIMGELICHMIRRHDFCKIRLVTAVAIARQSRVVAIRMAGGTFYRPVSAREREIGFSMIKCCRTPGDGGMALHADLWKLCGAVIRIFRIGVIILMAIDTIRWKSRKLAAAMTGGADKSCMCSCQREIRLRMIEIRWPPSIHRMTEQTVHRILICLVIRIPCGGIVLLMTDSAFRSQAGVLVGSMTTFALHSFVCTDQLKVRFRMIEC